MSLQQLDPNLGAAVGLRIILWRVLLKSLLQSLDSKFPERLTQQLDDRKLVVALESHLRISEPSDILNKRVNREPLLINSFCWHHMAEHCLAAAVPDDKKLHRSFACRLKGILI